MVDETRTFEKPKPTTPRPEPVYGLVTPSPEDLQTAKVLGIAREFSTAYHNADFSEPDEVRELDRVASELRQAILLLDGIRARDHKAGWAAGEQEVDTTH